MITATELYKGSLQRKPQPNPQTIRQQEKTDATKTCEGESEKPSFYVIPAHSRQKGEILTTGVPKDLDRGKQ